MANGYVRYGNSIHLDGFQILDFCIENAISLESLRDLNLGRKVFLTGNDTNAGYLRENVWDGDSWRAAAYLDDIDKINKKLDLIFGDELDTDTIIDSWKEVQDFLSGIEDTKNLMTMLDDKLSKSEGGTIESPIVVNSEYNYAITNNARGNWTGIRYRIADTTKGYLGINEEEKPIHVDAKQSQINFLLHSGNIGEYKAGGLVLGLSTDDYLYTKGVRAWYDWGNNETGNGVSQYSYGIYIGSHDISYGLQLASTTKEDSFLRARVKRDSKWDDWKTIAFTDSNVASATKLETSRAIWGQSFDGTGNVTGDLYLSPATNDGNALSTRLVFSGYSGMPYGPFIGTTSTSTGGYGRKNLVFMQRNETSWATDFKSHTIAMLINPLGNVSIGDSDRAGENIKLFVSGSVQIASGDLMLGNFCTIRSYKSDRLTPNTLIALTDKDLLVINQDGDVPTYIRGGNVGIGVLNPQYKLDVAGIGNFSSRVLIGGATDDGTSALQVNGHTVIKNNFDYNAFDTSGNKVSLLGLSSQDKVIFGIGAYYYQLPSALYGKTIELKSGSNVLAASFDAKGLSTFHQGALIPTGQKLTIGSVTFEEDAAGRVKVDGDMYTTGTLASGGKAKEGTGTGSGSANVRDFELPADGKTTYDCDHLLKSKNVIVQVFEKTIQNYIEVWEMILTDVTIVTEDRVTVTFGRPHNKVHRVHIIGGNVS